MSPAMEGSGEPLAGHLLIQRRDLGILSNIVGRLMVLVGLVMLTPLPVCAIFNERFAAPGFLAGSLLSFSLGFALYLPFKDAGEARTKHGMMAAAICWLLTPMVSAVPFLMVGEAIPPDSRLVCNMTVLDGYFEAMSGWTGTGLTMVLNEELLPRSIQFWRTLMQWVGGVGVIVLMLAILARPGTGSFSLYVGEGRTDKLQATVVETVRRIWKIFLVYTLVGIGVLFLLGMPLWDSINHAMTTLATGGFSVRDRSIESYRSFALEVALIPLMLIGAISFAVHSNVFRRRFKELIRDVQNKVLFALGVTGTAVLSIELFLGKAFPLLRSVRLSAFQFISALTCTGLQTADLAGWSSSAKMILSIAMIAGGAAGSTAGGIKLVRFILITKGANWKFMQTFMPSGMYIPKKLGNVVLSEEEMSENILEAATLSFMYIILLVVGIVVMMHLLDPTIPSSNVIFEVCSAQGNVGLTTGITGPFMRTAAKVMLIINMWAGRLEIFPVLMLMQSVFFYARPGRRRKIE